MDFDRSTQARSWLFDAASLAACRERADAEASAIANVERRVRKFASGFHSRFSKEREGSPAANDFPNSPFPTFSPSDKETLVRFHAHQIQALVGPTALLSELCTTETVLSTAIMLFRRFYLSNSILDINPRKMAAACAFFAAKLEEERIDIGLLSHATAVIHLKVQSAPLCRNELCAVSIAEIEEGERFLMEGLNYEFFCHHPENAIRVLATDLSSFLSESENSCFQFDGRDPTESDNRGHCSPRTTFDCEEQAYEYLDVAFDIWQRAIVFSDVPFMFAPGQIGFAVVTIAAGLVGSDGCMDDAMQEYLVHRLPLKTEEEIISFSRQVNRIIKALEDSPLMDLRGSSTPSKNVVSQRAETLRTVFSKAAEMRRTREMNRNPSMTRIRKRRSADVDFRPSQERCHMKLAKVTPTGQYHY